MIRNPVVHRRPTGYSLCWDWDYSVVAPLQAESYTCSVDDESFTLHAEAHGNITHTGGFYLLSPLRFMDARTINVFLFPRLNFERDLLARPLEKISLPKIFPWGDQ